MVVDRDRHVVECSIGEVTVQWGFNRWVAASVKGTKPARAQVKGRGGLAELLVSAGLPVDEAKSVSRESWRKRPTSFAHGEAQPWGSPWKERPLATLVVVLAGLTAMGLCIYWLDLSWVAV
jgi:hypothetical protein